MQKITVKRRETKFTSDPSRVINKFFYPLNQQRSRNIINRVLNLSEENVKNLLEEILTNFAHRHRNLKEVFKRNYKNVEMFVSDKTHLSEARKLLIGSYFTQEYSIEAAGFFNPSIVVHPDQRKIKNGEMRFILSFRATGEGHISSNLFRSGVVDKNLNITLDETSQFVTAPAMQMKGATYEARFTPDLPISERVLFPSTPIESNGMEDARFVEFQEETGTRKFFATYTAYDGVRIHSRLLTTEDFLYFQIDSLKGAVIENKGLALFPRKINGLYAMLSRQDNENNYIMFSEKLHCWETKKLLLGPNDPWDFVQIGNCGSPLETKPGWLVLSHGVGPMRRYVISAFLLDLQDPTKVIGRLRQPLLVPSENERDGYVPNVVYSCGSQIHNGRLIIPYAVSDYASSFATVDLDELLNELTASTV